MKNVVVAFLLSGAFALASAIPNHVVRITGYETGKYAANSAIEQSLDANVIAPIAKDVNGKRGRVVIWITGSADQTGVSSQNETLAKNRAEEVRAYLAQKLYEVKIDASITVRTRGDELNSKMVTVDWSVESQIQNTLPPKKATNWTLVAGYFALLTLAVMLCIRHELRRKTIVEAKVAIASRSPTSKTETLRVNDGDTQYLLLVTISEDGMIFLPFPTQENPNELLRRASASKARQAARQCINNPNYEKRTRQLIAEGKLIKIQNKEQAS